MWHDSGRGGLCVVTYCTREKSTAEGDMPAVERYLSGRIVEVHKIAEERDLPFFIVSGLFGLLDHNEGIPYYDHFMAAEEQNEVSNKVAARLIQEGFNGVVYYTKGKVPVQYIKVIEDACSMVDIALDVLSLD